MDTPQIFSNIIDSVAPIAETWGPPCIYALALASTLALVCLVFYFESAFFTLTAKDIANLKVKGAATSNGLLKLLGRPHRTLATVVITKFACLSTLTALLAAPLAWMEADFPSPAFAAASALSLASTILLSLTFGEVIPARIKAKYGHERLDNTHAVISFIDKLSTPLSLLIGNSTLIKRRMEMKTQHSISIDELSETLKLTSVEKKDEKDILQGIVNFSKISVDEIMRPRVDIVDIDIKDNFDDVINTIRESEYSRLPVYENSIDNVKGLLYIKDLLQHIDKGANFKWQELIREAYFVPESKKIDDLLSEFQEKRIHMAVVVDEFGGTSGIVTLEDILEVIVGDICDEHDDDEHKMYSAIDDKNYILEGKLSLNDFFKIKKIDTAVFQKRDWDADTLAGLILEINGDIPAMGDIIEYEDYKFIITSADDRRIKKVQLQIP